MLSCSSLVSCLSFVCYLCLCTCCISFVASLVRPCVLSFFLHDYVFCIVFFRYVVQSYFRSVLIVGVCVMSLFLSSALHFVMSRALSFARPSVFLTFVISFSLCISCCLSFVLSICLSVSVYCGISFALSFCLPFCL